MKCILAVCANSASLDKAANSVSLFGILDGVSSFTFPHSLSNLAILFILKKERGDRKGGKGEVKLSFKGAERNAAEIEKGKTPVDFNFEGKPNLRLLIRADGISIEGPGTLFSRIYHKDVVIGEWAIDVRHLKDTAK